MTTQLALISPRNEKELLDQLVIRVGGHMMAARDVAPDDRVLQQMIGAAVADVLAIIVHGEVAEPITNGERRRAH